MKEIADEARRRGRHRDHGRSSGAASARECPRRRPTTSTGTSCWPRRPRPTASLARRRAPAPARLHQRHHRPAQGRRPLPRRLPRRRRQGRRLPRRHQARATRLCWVTDIGWIMGAWTIIAAGSTGARLCLVEGSPTTPPNRLWELVERESDHVLGVSPSLTRGLDRGRARGAAARAGPAARCGSIGATGEPMSPEAYVWLAETVGERRCPIINISGGTEVGGAFLAPLPIQELKVSSLGGPGAGDGRRHRRRARRGGRARARSGS